MWAGRRHADADADEPEIVETAHGLGDGLVAVGERDGAEPSQRIVPNEPFGERLGDPSGETVATKLSFALAMIARISSLIT